jgi:flagellar protein FlaG
MHIDALQPREAAGASPPAASLPQPAHAVDDRSGNHAMAAAGKNLPQAEPKAIDVHVAAEFIDRFLREAGRELSFSVDEVTGHTVVSVRDPATGQLIRQVPSAEVLRIAANIDLVSATLISAEA